MAKTNVKTKTPAPRTHEGAKASRINHEQQLRRSVMACMLFEDNFYESGKSIADRIAQSAHHVPFEKVLGMAVEARRQNNLRHAPLWLVQAALNHPKRPASKAQMVETIDQVCQRADDMSEMLSMYWAGGKKKPLPAALKAGLAKAFQKFDAYRLSKYAKRGAIRLRDVMFLVHPKPKDKDQATIWAQLAEDTLGPPDTWEVSLSAGADKKETFTRLLKENMLGGLATLRNLRNMRDAGVERSLVAETLLKQSGKSGILPFQYIAAANAVPGWEDIIEPAMLNALKDKTKLSGKTVFLVDVSGSMQHELSGKSQLQRIDAAAALAMLLRECCEECVVATFSNSVREIRPRRGFALRTEIGRANGGTDTYRAVDWANKQKADRIIVITDEQSHTSVPAPAAKFGYIMNVGSYQNGIGYDTWTHIDGFSDNLLRFILAAEGQNDD